MSPADDVSCLLLLLRLQVPGARLALVGDGPQRQELEQMFQGMPVKFMVRRQHDVAGLVAWQDDLAAEMLVYNIFCMCCSGFRCGRRLMWSCEQVLHCCCCL
jgi:hypothetical protein